MPFPLSNDLKIIITYYEIVPHVYTLLSGEFTQTPRFPSHVGLV